MNLDRMTGTTHQMLGLLQRQWGELTDQRPHREAGERRQLAGRRLATYGQRQDEAKAQLRWLRHTVGGDVGRALASQQGGSKR